MSAEMRFCRSRRACSTFVSASVGGSQEKSSTSGERKAQGTWDSCRSKLSPVPRSRRPPQLNSSPAPFRAMLPLSPLSLTEVTHRQSAFLRLLPLRVGQRTRAEVTYRVLLRHRNAQSGACLLQFAPPSGIPMDKNWPSQRRGFPAELRSGPRTWK